jgi:hypothetical protein
MAVKRLPTQLIAEIDTVAKTLALVVTVPAADGEGDVDLHRIPIDLSGAANTERRRKLRAALADDG